MRVYLGYVVIYLYKILEIRYIVYVICNKLGFLYLYILGNVCKEYYMYLNDIDRIIMNNFFCISYILIWFYILEVSFLYLC